MHPFLTEAMARGHIEDLRRDAERHRLVAQARTGRAHRALGGWRSRAITVSARRRRPVAPTGANAPGPQPVCCPA